MKVTGSYNAANIQQPPASGTRTPRAVYETVLNTADRVSDTGEAKEDTAAYSVRISDQARAKAEFESGQRREGAAFESRARRDRSEFERRQQQEKAAFERQEAEKSAEFRRKQQAEARVFKSNYELRITNYE